MTEKKMKKSEKDLLEQAKATAFRKGIGAAKKGSARSENPHTGKAGEEALERAWARGYEGEANIAALIKRFD